MRILWLDKSQENPWAEKDAWNDIERHGFEITQCQFPVEAREYLQKKSFDLIVIRVEVNGALRLLEEVKRHSSWGKMKSILYSTCWTENDFLEHSKVSQAPDRHMRAPLMKASFLQIANELMGIAPLKSAAAPQSDEASSRLEAIFSAPAPEPSQRETGPVLVASPIMPPLAQDEQDIDLIRKYLHLRETELAKTMGETQELSRENRRLQKEISTQQVKIRELEHSYEEMSRKVIHQEKDLGEMERSFTAEREALQAERKTQEEKAKYLESQLATENERYEELKNRVRKDIRKIRLKERDLEAKLEISRRDSETLLHSRDKQVLEQQRKIDALEFDLDQIQDSRIQAESEAERYLAKLSRVARALHLAIGMIEDDTAIEEEELDDEPMIGGAALSAHAPSGAEVAPEAHAPGAVFAPLPKEPAPAELSDELAALANDGEPTRIGALPKPSEDEASDSNESQVIEDDSDKAIG